MKTCPKCNLEHEKSGIFCSRKCANGRIKSPELRQRLSTKMKGYKYGNARPGRPNADGSLPAGKIEIHCKKCGASKLVDRCLFKHRTPRFCSIRCASLSITTPRGGYRPNSGSNGDWYECKELNKLVYLDSSWELSYAKYLDFNDIKWIRPKPLDWIDCDGKQHKYYPDFYLIDSDELIDIKNDYLISLESTKDKIHRVESQNGVTIKILSKNDLAGIV
jgi:hypothetical protein